MYLELKYVQIHLLLSILMISISGRREYNYKRNKNILETFCIYRLNKSFPIPTAFSTHTTSDEMFSVSGARELHAKERRI